MRGHQDRQQHHMNLRLQTERSRCGRGYVIVVNRDLGLKCSSAADAGCGRRSSIGSTPWRTEMGVLMFYDVELYKICAEKMRTTE
jgi:hypothetical protein